MADQSFWLQMLEKQKEIALAYQDAILAITLNPQAEYTLDTGQNIQKVKYHDLPAIQESFESVMNSIAVLEKRTGVCSGIIIAKPSC